ncbi:FliO/MopB family protein [Pelomonas aquatica]|jgi:flagellar protein FliO/FliZ|uniref:Flagellar biogenesis protein n=1 Tax=Pelomonas aquatica TaxID=431058 RepID=A0A9X4LK27_9BURK|nr:flagellar biosynthetic protein FliO [Pelomonas aquatica]MCY4757364.1 flagellar biosynthetic protein FliO [Pelomonas aquatica]MDG0863912.1 flagellar biogenesis protein [Pelomonas aquatica]
MNASGLLPFLWFLAIVALIPVALWLLKRTPMGGAAATGVLRVVAQLPTAPNQRLLVVEVGQGEDRRWLVLGATAQHVTTLHVMPPQAEPPAPASFAKLLGKERGDAA